MLRLLSFEGNDKHESENWSSNIDSKRQSKQLEASADKEGKRRAVMGNELRRNSNNV